MDAPWSMHAPKLLLWALQEGLLVWGDLSTMGGVDRIYRASQACDQPCILSSLPGSFNCLDSAFRTRLWAVTTLTPQTRAPIWI